MCLRKHYTNVFTKNTFSKKKKEKNKYILDFNNFKIIF